MNCREASVQISLHVGDDLPAADVPALESHLEHCALCEADYESYASARDALQLVAEEYSGTTDLWDGIASQLGGSQGGSHASTTKRAWYRHPVFATGMAAALLIAASSPFWSGAKPAAEAMTDMVESAAMPAANVNVGLGIPDVTPMAGPLAIPATEDGVESVDPSETRDFLEESTQGRGMLQGEEVIAVPVSNRGAF